MLCNMLLSDISQGGYSGQSSNHVASVSFPISFVEFFPTVVASCNTSGSTESANPYFPSKSAVTIYTQQDNRISSWLAVGK